MQGGQTSPAIEIRGLTRRFGGRTAVHPVELAIGPGITGLLGPNGSGKSTLLRMLVGLVRPHGGAARVAGTPVRGDGTAARRRATYAPGEIGVYGEMRGREHLRWLCAGRGREALARAVSVAERLGLPLARRVHGYSHGMKRQLLFAAALGPRVPVRILDEPTEGLDPSKRREVLELLVEDAASGTAVLLSSHHLSEVDEVCARMVFLNEGRVVADEAADELRRRARRIVKLELAPGADAGACAAALRALDRADVRVHGRSLSVVLAGDDPRPLLGALATSDLPALRALSYGRPSLRDLYRDLYGVEGV